MVSTLQGIAPYLPRAQGDTAMHRLLVEGGVTGEVTLDLEEG